MLKGRQHKVQRQVGSNKLIRENQTKWQVSADGYTVGDTVAGQRQS